MANETTVAVKISTKSGGIELERLVKVARDFTGRLYAAESLAVGAAAIAMPLGQITDTGYLFVQHVGAADAPWIELGTYDGGTATFTPFVHMVAGDVGLFPLGCSAPYVRSGCVDAATTLLEYLAQSI